ncbi:putative tyrosinase-like protein tyr-3 [Actinia tenebrosa]|uniref:Tyrosinase-like protein tyr-3 n=1 Tax=Actinia tenebrosa TaxID=6105 RepID=A0A6P8IL76_ACTTE|nr:putative tyrosinase-like protein tyr-3 [Actinia tenebrosa]
MMFKLTIVILLVLSVQGGKAERKLSKELAADPQVTDAPPTVPPPPTTPKPTQPEICADVWSGHKCLNLHGSGWCYKNPELMKSYCKKTCNACNGSGNCNDLNLHCSFWASRGACQNNLAVMQRICRKSCKLC